MIAIIIGNIILNFIGGFVSSYGLTQTVPNVLLAPPKILFPIAWSILYVLLGITGGWLIENYKDNTTTEIIIFLYYLQLGLNFLWSITYFGMNLKLLSALIILAMIVITIIIIVYQTDVRYFLTPYLVWLVYAIYLNIASI